MPLRVRLVAGFSAAITVVLLAAGAFVYWRVSYALDLRLDSDTQQAADSLAKLVTSGGTLRTDPATTDTEAGRLYQILDSHGKVLTAGAGLSSTPLLSAADTAKALRSPLRRNVGRLLPRSAHPLRLLAVPVLANHDVLVVAVRRDQRDEALRELLAQLAIAGLGTLLVSAFVGESLAKAALSPVERYRTQAAAIAAGATGLRLDVPQDRNDEVTRLGDTLNSMLTALENTVAREKRFTADASHELRTPLTLLSTRVQLTLARPRSTDEYEHVLSELQIDIDELTALATELLDLSAAGESHPGAGTTVPGALAALQAAADERPSVSLNIAQSITSNDNAPPFAAAGASVAMAPGQLRQILNNLLTNAELHGEAPIGITAELMADTGKPVLRIAVSDAGTELPAEFLPRAAERFARAEDVGDRPGAGLGLALVAASASAAHGELRLCTQGVHHRFDPKINLPCEHPIYGTTASVLLPLRGAEPT